MSTIEIIFTIIACICLILVLVFIIVVLKKYIQTKKAISYALLNDLYCQNKKCPNPITNLSPPTSVNNSYDSAVARYCADLIVRVEKGIKSDIPQPKTLKKVGNLYDNVEDPIFGVVWFYNDIAWIIFRGTNEVSEWKQDFDISQGVLPKKHNVKQKQLSLRSVKIQPKVHSGFLNVYSRMRNDIFNYLKIVKPKKVVVSGHSLGAAISTICGIDLLSAGYNTIVYNFASPRVGDTALCSLIESKKLPLFRIVNNADVIPNTPMSVNANINDPTNPFFYSHCGELHMFQYNTKSIVYNHLMRVYIYALDNKLI